MDKFLEEKPLKVDSTWHVGERVSKTRVTETAGFNLLLAENDDTAAALALAHGALQHMDDLFRRLAQLQVAAYIDVACYLDPEEALSEAVVFEVDFLAALARYGVAVQVTTYASSGP